MNRSPLIQTIILFFSLIPAGIGGEVGFRDLIIGTTTRADYEERCSSSKCFGIDDLEFYEVFSFNYSDPEIIKALNNSLRDGGIKSVEFVPYMLVELYVLRKGNCAPIIQADAVQSFFDGLFEEHKRMEDERKRAPRVTVKAQAELSRSQSLKDPEKRRKTDPDLERNAIWLERYGKSYDQFNKLQRFLIETYPIAPYFSQKTNESLCKEVFRDFSDANFQGNEILEELVVAVGPVYQTFLDKIINDPNNPFVKLRKSLLDKYELDWEFTERDRKLFNEGKKDNLYLSFEQGRVLLEVRSERGENQLYVRYSSPEIGKNYLNDLRPQNADFKDF